MSRTIADLPDTAIKAIAASNAADDFKYNRGHRPEPTSIARASLDQVTLYRTEYERSWSLSVHRWRVKASTPLPRRPKAS